MSFTFDNCPKTTDDNQFTRSGIKSIRYLLKEHVKYWFSIKLCVKSISSTSNSFISFRYQFISFIVFNTLKRWSSIMRVIRSFGMIKIINWNKINFTNRQIVDSANNFGNIARNWARMKCDILQELNVMA